MPDVSSLSTVAFRAFSIYLSFFFVLVVHGERLEDQIYVKLNGGKYQCFRLLNGTDQVGCQSAESGNVGILFYLSSTDPEAIERLRTDFGSAADLIVAVDVNFLDRSLIKELMREQVRGVLLFDDPDASNFSRSELPLSEDSVCPNSQFSLYEDSCQSWNREGAITPEGLRFIDWQKPVFLIDNKTEIDILKNRCYYAFNRNGLRGKSPYCAVRLKLFMRAAGNANICLRRQEYFYGFSESSISLCDPLEDENVFAILPPPVKHAESNKTKLFVLATRMDSFSSFSEAAVGDVSVLTSVIAALSVAKAIGQNLKTFEEVANRTHRSLMFSFFHGESMGYIGSSRTIYDMKKGEFPKRPELSHPPLQVFNVSNVDVFVEIQQIEDYTSSFSAHVDGFSYAHGGSAVVDELVVAANEAVAKLDNRSSISIFNRNESAKLPSSSYEVFLKEKRSLAGFVATSFDSEYSYKRVNSFADRGTFTKDPDLIKRKLVLSATAILGSVVKYVYGKEKPTVDFLIDSNFVSDLFDCFVSSSDWYKCRLFKNILQHEKNRPPLGWKSTYIAGGHSFPSLIRLIINAILVHCLGSGLANVTTESQCNDLNKHQQVYRYTWQFDDDPMVNASVCYRNALYSTPARSPAFDDPTYDMESGVLSTWVESVWTTQELVVFLSAYPRRDVFVFLSGVVMLVFSLLLMHFVYLGNREFIEPAAPPRDADVNAAPL